MAGTGALNGCALKGGRGRDRALAASKRAHAHAGHIRRITEGRPQVLLKLAVSADGKVGAGRPQADTYHRRRCPLSKFCSMRASSDAIFVGIGTVMSRQSFADLPFAGDARSFARSRRPRCPTADPAVPYGRWATARETPTWIVCLAPGASAMAEQVLRGQRRPKCCGSKQVTAGSICRKFSIHLPSAGITRLMVEGGPTVVGVFRQGRSGG